MAVEADLGAGADANPEETEVRLSVKAAEKGWTPARGVEGQLAACGSSSQSPWRSGTPATRSLRKSNLASDVMQFLLQKWTGFD